MNPYMYIHKFICKISIIKINCLLRVINLYLLCKSVGVYLLDLTSRQACARITIYKYISRHLDSIS